MEQILTPIIWVLVLALALFLGRLIAIRLNRSDGDVLRRGQCPQCRGKTLHPTPISLTAAIITCEGCGSQWLVEGADGQRITNGPGARTYFPPITFHWDEPYIAVFRTDGGVARFNMADLPLKVSGEVSVTPRELLQALAAAGVKPAFLDVFRPPYDLETFLDSAGIDPPIGTEERTD